MSKKYFTNEFSEEIFNQTYKIEGLDNKIEDVWTRISKSLASVEEDSAKWEKEFFKLLEDFKFVPGGRILSNAGANFHGTTLINCFVSGHLEEEKDIDSIKGIFNEIKRCALILKSEGGYGFCSNFMRPRGSYISGIGVSSPGAVEMLNLWDTTSSVITKGSNIKKTKKGKNKIRKGAMMVTMSIEHPDIEEFISAKQTQGKLTKFNMSVLISNKFMNAVKKHKKWELWYPDTTFEKYKEEWRGDFQEWEKKGYPKIIYKTFDDANELWNLIMKSTYNRNEPGVLFVDRMNELNNLYYIEKIQATNPCGEQILPSGGSCLLGSINLTQFVNNDRTDFDYEKLDKLIPVIVRMQDNVNDISNVPLSQQKQELLNKRRIGIGYLGYGSALYMMKIPYGSEKALKLTEKLVKFVTNKLYQSSALLAKEKGAFKLFNKEKYLNSKFVKQALTKETKKMIEKYGIRNSHLTSIQPTGNTSILSNCVSGGLEPVFMPEYIRTIIVPNPPKDLPPVNEWPDKVKEGDEELPSIVWNGIRYKYDNNRGITKEQLVEDYGVRLLKEEGEWDPKAEWASTVMSLTTKEHTDTMKVFAKYIDSAMSKTINLPNDYSFEDFKNVYMDLYESKVIKGGTTYRAGTMTAVLSEVKKEKDKEDSSNAIKRPEILPCDVHRVSVNKEKWVVFVSMLNNKPYEIFAGLEENVVLPNNIKTGKIHKKKLKTSNKYWFESGDLIIKDILAIFHNKDHESITRLVSTSLRHGIDIKFIVTQLNKSNNQFSKVMSRILKKYIKEGEKLDDIKCLNCGKKSIIMLEGCNKCTECGFSGCS